VPLSSAKAEEGVKSASGSALLKMTSAALYIVAAALHLAQLLPARRALRKTLHQFRGERRSCLREAFYRGVQFSRNLTPCRKSPREAGGGGAAACKPCASGAMVGTMVFRHR